MSLLYEPTKNVGKAGLESTAWLNAGRILRLPQIIANQRLSSQHRSIPHSSSALVCLFMHHALSMAAYTRRRCTSIRIPPSQHVSRDCAPSRMFFRARRIARRIGSSILIVACYSSPSNSNLDRLVHGLLRCRDDRVSPACHS